MNVNGSKVASKLHAAIADAEMPDWTDMEIIIVRHEAVSRSCLHGNGGDHLCHQMKLRV